MKTTIPPPSRTILTDAHIEMRNNIECMFDEFIFMIRNLRSLYLYESLCIKKQCLY